VVGSHGIYAMRIMSALANATLIALGLFLLARYHPKHFTLVGALVALSPMVFFITAVINASGLEVAAGFAAWCGGLALVERDPIPGALVKWVCVTFAVLILARPLSPVYAAILAVTLMLRAGRQRLTRIRRDPSIGPLWVTTATSVVVAGAFFIADGSPKLLGTAPPSKLDFVATLKVPLRLTWTRLRETIGDFGWLDTPAPHATVLIWVLAAVALVVMAVVLDRHCRYALIFLSVAILALPLVLESPKYNSTGTYWQGRYWLPLIVGIPLVASTASIRWHLIDKALRKRRWVLPISVLAVGAVLIGAQVDAFATMLRRYEVGLGPGPHLRPRWSPPGGSALLTVLLVIGEVLLVCLVAWHVTARRRDGAPTALLNQ
jgi:hypothetical protein